MSDSRYQEVEVKLFLEDLQEMGARLAAAGAERTIPRVFERNVRYEDQDSTLSDRGIVLRLRQDRGIRLTYKEPMEQNDPDVLRRFEAEVTVDDFDTMDLILKRLGFEPFMVYEKYRTTYSLQGVEIVLDEMPYGHFMEIEGEANAIRAVLDRLQLHDFPRFHQNYLLLFYRVRDYLGLTFNDLSFENFEGIEVPMAAFGSPDN